MSIAQGSLSPCLASLIVFEQPTDTLRACLVKAAETNGVGRVFCHLQPLGGSYSLSHVDTAGNTEATPTPVHTNGNAPLQSDVNCPLTGLHCSYNTFTDSSVAVMQMT